jgi:hypothetical protein
MQGEIFLAKVNRALTLIFVSPTYFRNNVDGVTHRKRAFAVPARARTIMVFPQPLERRGGHIRNNNHDNLYKCISCKQRERYQFYTTYLEVRTARLLVDCQASHHSTKGCRPSQLHHFCKGDYSSKETPNPSIPLSHLLNHQYHPTF